MSVPAQHTAAPTAVKHMPNRKAVNIVAMGSSRNDFLQAQLMEQRPDLLMGAEIWTINYMGAVMHCDRVIHVDPVHEYLGHPPVRDMCEYSLKNNIPVYTSHPHPKFPNHVIYPFDRVSAWFGGITYFNTSVAYAIGLAMADGFNEIGLFGCDFSYPDVHVAESGRACCEFLMGIGHARGIKFAIGHTSTLMDSYNGQQPYGWFADPHHPPVNGGKLMNAAQILQHVERVRNPPQKRDLIQVIQPLQPPSAVTGGAGGTSGFTTAGGGGGAWAGYAPSNGYAGGYITVDMGGKSSNSKPNGHDTSMTGAQNAADNLHLPNPVG